MEYLSVFLHFIWQAIGVLFGIGVLLALAFVIIGTVQELKERKHGRK